MFPYFWKHPLPCFPAFSRYQPSKNDPFTGLRILFFSSSKPSDSPPNKPPMGPAWQHNAEPKTSVGPSEPEKCKQFLPPKKKPGHSRKDWKGSSSEPIHFFGGVSCFNFGGVNRGLMWRAWTTWGINEVPKTSLIRVYEPIIRVYNGLYYLGFACSMLGKITNIHPKLWFFMVMHTMGSNP